MSEYAKLQGLREENVLAVVGQFEIPAAYFRGQWFIEAPPNCEARLAQLRGATPTPTPAPTPLRQPNDSGQKIAATQPSASARRPQPIDYGLTFDDLSLYSTWESRNEWSCPLDDGQVIRCFGTRNDDEYKKGRRWFGVLLLRDMNSPYKAGAAAFWLLLLGGLCSANPHSFSDRVLGLALLGVGLLCLLYAVIPGAVIKRLRKHASPALKAYWQAFHQYDDNKRAAEAAARATARDAELRKRSYWTFLDGYGFERATAEVLNKHQFNAWVTPGSGDGGVDIEVTRNGLRGVVQCKAHMSAVGPAIVRDLFGVIHHTGASFGIIVSLGGFTKGAFDFRRDKPILFVNLDDLIAMQEGKDVLAEAFSSASPDTKS